ncbi:MAG: response regulator [Alphaproteobacteria bacterium]
MATILLAEDDHALRHFLKVSLERAGHEVVAVGDGEEAMRWVITRDFDLLLADVVMPGTDGIELARRARPMRPAMRVMFITGFAAMTLKAKSALGGQTTVLSKPFHLKDLATEVDTVLAGGRQPVA